MDDKKMLNRLKNIGRTLQGLIVLWILLSVQPVFAYTFPSNMPSGCSGGNGNYTCNSPPMYDHWDFSGDTSSKITVTVNGDVTVNNYTFGTSADMLNDGSRLSRITVIFLGNVTMYAPTVFMNLELHGDFKVLNGNLPALRGAILSPDVGRSLIVAGGVNYVRSDFGPITINGGSGTGISSGTCIQATTAQPIYNNTNNWPNGSGVCCGTIDGTCSNSCVVNGNGIARTPPACPSNPANLLAQFTMEEQTVWNGHRGS